MHMKAIMETGLIFGYLLLRLRFRSRQVTMTWGIGARAGLKSLSAAMHESYSSHTQRWHIDEGNA